MTNTEKNANNVPYRQLHLKRKSLQKVLPLGNPWALDVETINTCNFRCVMCPMGRKEARQAMGPSSKLPTELVMKLLDDLAEMGAIAGDGRLRVFRPYGFGEPLLDARIPDFIAHAHERGALRSELTSNASLLDEVVADRLVASGLSYLRVSIYGPDEEIHKATSRSRVPLETIRQNIINLGRIRERRGSKTPRIVLKMLARENAKENEDFLRNFRPLADEIFLDRTHDFTSQEPGAFLGVPKSALAPTCAARRVCPFAFYSLVVKSDAKVVICCLDYSRSTVVGDLSTESIRDIWHGKRLREFRLLQLEGRRKNNMACCHCTAPDRHPDNLDDVPPHEFRRIVGY